MRMIREIKQKLRNCYVGGKQNNLIQFGLPRVFIKSHIPLHVVTKDSLVLPLAKDIPAYRRRRKRFLLILNLMCLYN